MIGMDKHPLEAIGEDYRDRLLCFTTDFLGMTKDWQAFAGEHVKLPIYISIDKDVLRPQEEITDWDQGNMSIAMLEAILRLLIRCHTIIGIDICGECPDILGKGLEAVKRNDSVNQKLMEFLKSQVL